MITEHQPPAGTSTIPAVTHEVPNEVTMAAIRETEEMQKHPENYKGYTDVDKMMEDILSEP